MARRQTPPAETMLTYNQDCCLTLSLSHYLRSVSPSFIPLRCSFSIALAPVCSSTGAFVVSGGLLIDTATQKAFSIRTIGVLWLSDGLWDLWTSTCLPSWTHLYWEREHVCEWDYLYEWRSNENVLSRKSGLSCAVVTAAIGSSNYENMRLCHYFNDIMERLKAISCIMLRNRERDMLGQLPRWIRRLSGDETTFSAHVLKWCHWSTMGPLSASFLYRLISRKTNTTVS